MRHRHVAEVGKPVRRAIVLNREHPCHGYGQEAIAQGFGLRGRDLIWITNAKDWRKQLTGLSRSTLVIDPCNLTHEWCIPEEAEFALGIRAAFDNVVMAPCGHALAKWLRVRNPPAYARMVAYLGCENGQATINDDRGRVNGIAAQTEERRNPTGAREGLA